MWPLRESLGSAPKRTKPSTDPLDLGEHGVLPGGGNEVAEPVGDLALVERVEHARLDHARIPVLPGGDEHGGERLRVGGRPRAQHGFRWPARGQLAALEPLAKAEAVAPVERAHVLDRASACIEREPREQEQRRGRAATEQPRLARAGDRRLDRLLGRGELDAVVGMEQLVEGDVLPERGRDTVEPLGVEVQHLDRDRLTVGKAESLDLQHLGSLTEAERARDLGIGRDAADVDQLRARLDAVRRISSVWLVSPRRCSILARATKVPFPWRR